MQLYSASTGRGLRNTTRRLTNTNTSTYTDIDLDAALNDYYHLFVGEILQSMDDWDFQGDYATADLVASQQEYVLPLDILKIKSVEISYDGTNWYKGIPIDKAEIITATDATNNSRNFNVQSPMFDLMDGSVFLYPIPSANSTAGLKIWFEKDVTDLTDVADEPVFVEAYHKGLCYGAAKDYFEKYLEVDGNAGKRDRMDLNLKETIASMKEFYATRDQERSYIVTDYDADMDREYGIEY